MNTRDYLPKHTNRAGLDSPTSLASTVRQRRSVHIRPFAVLLVIGAMVVGASIDRREHVPAIKTPLAAIVNGLPVSMISYRRQLRFASDGYAGPRPAPRSPAYRTLQRILQDQAVQQAIAEVLIDAAAVKHDLTVSSQDLHAAIDRMARSAGGAASFEAQMHAAGMSVADVESVARHIVLRDRVGMLLHDPAWLDHAAARATVTYFVGDGAANPDALPIMEQGHPAPPFLAVDLRGHLVSLADLRGRPVVLNFWTTSCGDCQAEMPMLLRYTRAHPQVAVLALDTREDPALVRAFIRAHHLQGLRVWVDPTGMAYQSYTMTTFPATFFIDSKGIMRSYNFGPLADEGALAAQAADAVHGRNNAT